MRLRRLATTCCLLATASAAGAGGDPTDGKAARAANLRGEELLVAGDLAGAIAAFDEATRRDPGAAAAWSNLGWARLRRCELDDSDDGCADWDAAVAAEERAVATTSSAAVGAAAQYNLGRIAADRGDLATALAHYDESLRLRPGDRTVKRTAALLRGLPELARLAGLDRGAGDARLEIAGPIELAAPGATSRWRVALVHRIRIELLPVEGRQAPAEIHDAVLVLVPPVGDAVRMAMVQHERFEDQDRSPRFVELSLTRMSTGGGGEVARVDVKRGNAVRDHAWHAVTTLFAIDDTGQVDVAFDQVTATGNTVSGYDVGSRLRFGDVDGDGQAELIVTETEVEDHGLTFDDRAPTARRRRRVVYHRHGDRFETAQASMIVHDRAPARRCAAHGSHGRGFDVPGTVVETAVGRRSDPPRSRVGSPRRPTSRRRTGAARDAIGSSGAQRCSR